VRTASAISTSELTLVECDRAVHRRFALGDISSTRANELRANVAIFAGSWNVIQIGPEILSRARQSFPEEPIRALDALHIASALHARVFAPDVAILSIDDRIRRVGTSLGFDMLPA
jgi:predicted nucleic acid-binding protein